MLWLCSDALKHVVQLLCHSNLECCTGACMHATVAAACTMTFLATAAVTEPEKQHSWIELLEEMQTTMAAADMEQVLNAAL
jgi:hypothetical protein